MQPRVPDHILAIPAYEPGKPIEEVVREFGVQDPVKLASNENPLGPSPKALEAVRAHLDRLHRYPDMSGRELTLQIASRLSVEPAGIVLGNGSDDLIVMLGQALLNPGDAVVMPQPGFQMYEIVARTAGARPVQVPLKDLTTDLAAMAAAAAETNAPLVFVNNPHNPAGTTVTRADFEAFLAALPPHTVVALDEAYIEFARTADCPRSTDYLDAERTVIGLRTFSKLYGLAGLRVGYGLMPPQLAAVLHRVRQPFNVNSLALAAAQAALQDEDFVARTLALVHQGIDFLGRGLAQRGIEYQPTQANFLLVRLGPGASGIARELLKLGVIVRAMASYGYDDRIRVTAGLPAENERFLHAIDQVLGTPIKL